MRWNRRNDLTARASFLAMAAALAVAGGLIGQEEESPAVRTIDATGGRELEGWQKVRVRIENDLVPARTVIVSVVSPTRPELVLGMVPSNGTREWEIDTRSFVAGFQLVAQGSPRDITISRGISIVGGALVSWDLGSGLVRVRRTEAAEVDTRG